MKKTEYYGLSRSRDKKGVVVKKSLNPYVSCIHATVEGIENMWVLIAEVYEETI